jgi:spore germination protein GerM
MKTSEFLIYSIFFIGCLFLGISTILGVHSEKQYIKTSFNKMQNTDAVLLDEFSNLKKVDIELNKGINKVNDKVEIIKIPSNEDIIAIVNTQIDKNQAYKTTAYCFYAKDGDTATLKCKDIID